MQISILLADYAALHPDGTCSMVRGGINQVLVPPGKPMVLNGTILVHALSNLDDYGKEYGFSIEIVNEDGVFALPPLIGVLQFPENKPSCHSIVFNVNAALPRLGRYEIRMRVKGELKVLYPFEIVTPTAPTASISPEVQKPA